MLGVNKILVRRLNPPPVPHYQSFTVKITVNKILVGRLNPPPVPHYPTTNVFLTIPQQTWQGEGSEYQVSHHKRAPHYPTTNVLLTNPPQTWEGEGSEYQSVSTPSLLGVCCKPKIIQVFVTPNVANREDHWSTVMIQVPRQKFINLKSWDGKSRPSPTVHKP